jgi:hypothetical protein
MSLSINLARFTKGELVKLATEEWHGRTVFAIIEAIDQSFENDQVIRPVRTQSEIERRFEICIRWFVELRRELHWSIPRILDALPMALRSALDGIPFNPDEERAAWHGAIGPELEVDGEDLVGEVPNVVGAIEAEDYLD